MSTWNHSALIRSSPGLPHSTDFREKVAALASRGTGVGDEHAIRHHITVHLAKTRHATAGSANALRRYWPSTQGTGAASARAGRPLAEMENDDASGREDTGLNKVETALYGILLTETPPTESPTRKQARAGGVRAPTVRPLREETQGSTSGVNRLIRPTSQRNHRNATQCRDLPAGLSRN